MRVYIIATKSRQGSGSSLAQGSGGHATRKKNAQKAPLKVVHWLNGPMRNLTRPVSHWMSDPLQSRMCRLLKIAAKVAWIQGVHWLKGSMKKIFKSRIGASP